MPAFDPTKGFILHVSADGNNVWCTNVPADMSDKEVWSTICYMADAGDEVAARAEALALTPSRYVPLCLAMGKLDGGHTRVYLDNA